MVLAADVRTTAGRLAGRSAKAVAAASADLHVQLNTLNRVRLQPALPVEAGSEPVGSQWRCPSEALLVSEARFLEADRAEAAGVAAGAPTDVDDFVDWFQELRGCGAGQDHPLFDFLEQEATFEEVRWFVRQEVAGEAGFEDLVALTQLRMPVRAKLEMARNYWDEMGRGKRQAMHGPLLANLAFALDVAATAPDEIVWESLAVANLMAGLAFHRHYAFQSVGALGVIELTAPTRAPKVTNALHRVGIGPDASRYFRLHAVVDVAHSRAWNTEVIATLVAERPELAVHIAQGAVMRLNAGARTFERYATEFGISTSQAGARRSSLSIA